MATHQQRHGRVEAEDMQRAEFPADTAAANIAFQRLGCLAFELRAMRTAERAIFEQSHRRVGVAHAIAAVRCLADHLRPVASGWWLDRRNLVAAGGRDD